MLQDKQRLTTQIAFSLQEKQRLTTEAEICRRKMSRASTLINGLSGEKLRWTMQSKAFKEQMVRLIGDVLLSTGYILLIIVECQNPNF